MLLDISGSEDVLKVYPLLLADNPLLHDLIQSEKVLLELFSKISKRLDIPTSQDHVDSGEAFIKCLENDVDFVDDLSILILVLLYNEIYFLPIFIECVELGSKRCFLSSLH